MTTLADQIKADYLLQTPSPVFDETDLDRLSELAAAEVESYVGGVDGDDTAAVALGVDLLEYRIAKATKQLGPAELGEMQAATLERLANLRDMRRQAVEVPVIRSCK